LPESRKSGQSHRKLHQILETKKKNITTEYTLIDNRPIHNHHYQKSYFPNKKQKYYLAETNLKFQKNSINYYLTTFKKYK
ncbi:MAG: hypothetical protein Q6366_009660, partial [Candidatus Freyarchaeota archaeon]